MTPDWALFQAQGQYKQFCSTNSGSCDVRPGQGKRGEVFVTARCDHTTHAHCLTHKKQPAQADVGGYDDTAGDCR